MDRRRLRGGPVIALLRSLVDLPEPYPYPEPAWSPYLVGALIGVLSVLSLAIAQRRVGASSGYAAVAGLAARATAPGHVARFRYFREHPPAVSWTLVFVLGTVLGSFLSAWTGDELTGTYLQGLWVARFGEDSVALRTALAFVGGAAMAYGARLAGGCTSGHGISGTMQLSLGSWVAAACFFIGGILVAYPLYRL